MKVWRMFRQKSTNKWLPVVNGRGTDTKGSWADPDAPTASRQLSDYAAAYGIPVADLESWEGQADAETLMVPLRAGQVPSLPPGYPVCTGVVPAVRSPLDSRDQAQAKLTTAMNDPLNTPSMRDALRALLAILR